MTSVAGPAPGRPGRRIGKYVLTGRIGKGGMGRVYRGYDEALEREVAVKTLSLEGTLDEDHRRRFSIEAKAAARLQHPNIVTVYELGEDRGVPYIAMELLPGADLESLLRSGDTLLLRETIEIMSQVCRGLHFAHERGIVHRDIKPSNIRVLDDGTAKIMDFGIAKLGASGITKTGMMVGTVHYMSPEQIRGHPLDGRSDVFSVGVILYELLARRRPFRGDTATEILYKIVHEEAPVLPAEALGTGGEALQEAVRRALAKDVAQRFPNALALADELSRIAAAQPSAPVGSVGETLKSAQKLVQDGKLDEALGRLRELTNEHPHSVEVRRALRWADREAQRRCAPPVPESDDFPELEATFQAPPTTAMAEPAPTPPAAQVAPAPAAPAGARPADRVSGLTSLTRLLPLPAAVSGRPVLAVGAVALVLAALAGSYFLLRGKETSAPAQQAVVSPPAQAATPAPPPAGARATVALLSDPPGAHVALDGVTLEGVTPLSLTLDPSIEHRVKVTLAGHAVREVPLAAGRPPAELRVALEPVGPTGKVSVVSAYPVDVLWKGRVLAKGQTAAQVSLPLGKQTLTLVSSAYLMRANVTAEVRADAVAELRAPELGRINIRANPDNCQVLIDGAFIDYPPILDRPLSPGTHTVTFKWPDGTRRQETVEVERGRPAYVMGRRD